jgi:hypothetical protein
VKLDFASSDRSFQVFYLAQDLTTGVAEAIVRDRFEEQTDRRLHAGEVSVWLRRPSPSGHR